MPTVIRALLIAVVFTALPVGIGVATTSPQKPTRPSAYVPTPLTKVDTTTLHVHRGPFCDHLPTAAVTAALDAAPTSAKGYADGDRQPVGGTTDVVHEYGCTYAGGQGRAQAWVFAPPIVAARAKQLLAQSDRGCVKPAQAPAFGDPTTASLCGSKTRTATFRGLFGDAWLSCSVTAPHVGTPDAALLDRAGKWCVAVARATAPGTSDGA